MNFKGFHNYYTLSDILIIFGRVIFKTLKYFHSLSDTLILYGMVIKQTKICVVGKMMLS